MKILLRLLRLCWIFLRFFLVLLVVYALFQYLCAPAYDFPAKQAFKGKRWYNPYQSCNPAWWKKAVFHKHADGWGGLKFKKDKTQATFYRYKYLGYDIVALSDYQHINPAKYEKQIDAIPNYEHGWGMKKNHHLNIGARSVLPFDFLFPQTASNKQFIINLLRPRTEVLALAHPDWYSAVKAYDVKRLCDYDCMEIFSNYHNSINIWDSALSAGMPVFLIADDDNEKIENPNVVGRCMTLVNAINNNQYQVTSALKQGRTIGVRVFSRDDESWDFKRKNIEAIPVLESLKVSNDTLHIVFSKAAKKVAFIGQNGLILDSVSNAMKAFYVLNDSDTYVRTEITFINGTIFYLNPVIRYNGKSFDLHHATINIWITILKNSFFVALLVLLFFILRGKKKKKRKGHIYPKVFLRG